MLWKFNWRIWPCLRGRVNFFRKGCLSSASPIDRVKSPQTYTLKEALPPIPSMSGVPWTSESPSKGPHLCLTSQRGKYEHLQFQGWSRRAACRVWECKGFDVHIWCSQSFHNVKRNQGWANKGDEALATSMEPWVVVLIPQHSHVELQGGLRSLNSVYSRWTFIWTLALSPKNVRGGPIWSGLCKRSWHWLGKERRGLSGRGAHMGDGSEAEWKMRCLRT